MILVIAEKPSVAQSIAKVLGATSRKDGYMEGGNYIVSWCFGHLVELADASSYDERYAKWRYDDLPIVPESWMFEVTKDKTQQFKVLSALMKDKRVTELICATDAGREGELIFRLVYNKAGCTKPFKRLWISSLEDSAIREGFNHLRDSKEYDRLYEAALSRSKADWIVGINGTRLFTTLYHKKLVVGRVQTPTLAMLVERDGKISTFQKEKYFNVHVGKGDLTADLEKVKTEEEAKRIAAACEKKQAVVSSLKRETKTVNPPKLYDLTTLQREANRYGYIKDPNDPKHWIVDDEAAQVVRRVYSMTLEGFGTEQIAAQLEKDDVLTPRAYWLTKGIKRPGKGKQQPPTKWNSSTITKILSLQEYCGDILNFKTYSKSYKNKKRIDNDRENWVVFQDVHEAIIERAVYEQVQQKRGKIRKRRTNNGEHNMFSGLLVCADCGSNLHFHFNQGNPEIKYFNCSNYKGNRGTCTSTHYVRVDFLEEVVLGEIRRLMKFASLYEDEFVKAVIGHSKQAEQTDRKLKEKELRTLLARDEELDGLFERIYEDNVSGKLSDDRFAKMSRRYEDEQKELSEKIKKLRSEIEKQSSRSMTTDMFIGLVRKYTRARKLTPRMLNELIEKIEVFNAEKIDGVWEQRLRIHYNCVGTIEIPTALPLPIPEVSVNTRKGVVVNYAPCELAV